MFFALEADLVPLLGAILAHLGLFVLQNRLQKSLNFNLRSSPTFYSISDCFWNCFGLHFGVKFGAKTRPKFGAESGGLPSGWNRAKTQVFAEAVGVGTGVKFYLEKINKIVICIQNFIL